MPQTTPYTATEITNIRRFAGYPAFASFGYLFTTNLANLDQQINAMSDSEQAVIRTVYLTILPVMEADINSSAEFANVQSAGPFTRNPHELSERRRLFNMKRRDMCAFIGVAPGPGLNDGSRVVRC